LIGLQELALEQNLRTKDIGLITGVNAGTVCDWYNNKVPNKHLKILSDKFNVEEDYINKRVNEIDTYEPRQKGFNEYKVIGNITEIYAKKRDGRIFTILIDTEDLQMLIDLGYRWSAVIDPNGIDYYVQTTYYYEDRVENGRFRQTRITLHQTIMNDIMIDHINHKSLDNRKENLRFTNKVDNATNRRGKNKNNKSGYRNVSWNGNGWSVQLQINGVGTCLKRFKKDDVENAGAFAEEMRLKYYGDFAGES